MKRFIAASLLAAAATGAFAQAKAVPHNEQDEDLRITPEMSSKTSFNMAVSFRLAYVKNPAMKVGDKITWRSPFSGLTSMTLREFQPDASRYDFEAIDKTKLAKKLEDMSEEELVAAGAVKRTAACYHFRVEEKDLAPASEVARSKAAIKRGNYQSYDRSHSESLCVEQVPIEAMKRTFMRAQKIPEATIKAYQNLFPEGSQIPYRIVMGGSSVISKTPREPAAKP